MTKKSDTNRIERAREAALLVLAPYILGPHGSQFDRHYAKWQSGTIAELIAKAPRDTAAYDTLLTLLRHADPNTPGFDELREWGAQAAEGKIKRPPLNRGGGSPFILRDPVIIHAVHTVVSFGLDPTSSAPDSVSACEVVKKVLEKFGVIISVEGIAKIWNTRDKSSPLETKAQVPVE